MSKSITMEDLNAYLDEALSDEASSRVEKALRDTPPLRRALSRLIAERERGEHSLGAIWRRHRLTCPTREDLGNLLLGVLDPEFADYIKFHLQSISCGYCQANLMDLQERQKETKAKVQERRQKMFASSAGFLPKRKK
jgi:hypothetical protein